MRGEVAPAREAHENCPNLLSGSADISDWLPRKKEVELGEKTVNQRNHEIDCLDACGIWTDKTVKIFY